MSYGSVIAAISTPSGKGGVALIRVSGICERVFKPKSKKKLSELPERFQVWGDIIKNGEKIDDGMATVFRAPASYTGEDTVEITCHGGILITERVLEAIFTAGAVPAERGEFTERAFINGKLSLTDAEAIGNLIEAKSDEQIRLASQKSRTRLTEALEKIRADLTELLASVFARIDYPDEDLGDFTNEQTLKKLRKIKADTEKLISTYSTARAINEGINAVICGKPNVGKSSLYNALLGEDAAIVTDIEGTTRDILSQKLPLGRVMLNVSDTAGLRASEAADTVEKIGMQRSERAIEGAELIIAVFDGARPVDSEDNALISRLLPLSVPKIAVINKSDLEQNFTLSEPSAFDKVISVSAKDEEKTREQLAKIIDGLFTDEKLIAGEDAIVASARQNATLISLKEYVTSAIEAFEAAQFTDAAASEIELALGAISETDGKAVCEDVLNEIFSKFCVGK